MAKLEESLRDSTYRDRGGVFGHGSNSNNQPCEIESFNDDLLTPEICMVCATTRYDPLLPYIGNRLGHGRDYYKLYCTSEQEFQDKGSGGYISRGPALYGLFLAKVKAFYDEHTDHVVNATGEILQDGVLLYSPLVLHVNFWGEELKYPQYIQVIAEQLIDIRDTQLTEGIILSWYDLTSTQKNLQKKIIDFLELQERWEERKIAFDEYKETSIEQGTKKVEPILPYTEVLDISENDNLDDFFDPNTDIPF